MRVYFDLPDSGYVVLDELTPYASGKDAIPEDTVTSIWKLVSPVEYIPSGKNFAYPDATAFNEFVYGMTTLVGDRVVEYNLDVALLEKYGLTEPELGASYTFKGYTVYLWFSEKNESGNRYCYSSIVGKDDSGEEVTMSTDIIAEISPETAPWLEYDALTFLDPGIFSMYINKIDEITMSYGGNDYVFALTRNDAGEFTTVTCNGQTVDTQNFRYLYVSILNLKLEGEYSESDSPAGRNVPPDRQERQPHGRDRVLSGLVGQGVLYAQRRGAVLYAGRRHHQGAAQHPASALRPAGAEQMRGKPLRRLALCCAAALLLNGCGGAPDTSDYPVLEAAVASANDAGCKQVKFLMQFTFGEERTTMLFAQGEYTVDTENGYVLSGRMSQTVLGASVTVTFSYADGWYAYTIDGQTMKRAYEEETLRSGFLFSDAFLFGETDVTSMTRSSATPARASTS